MLIGVPKEIKTKEFRVGLTPTSVREVVGRGHSVIVETNAGMGINYSDDDYLAAGAEIAASAAEVFEKADMIVKVKEPQPVETAMLRPDQILFTYLHLAADPVQADGLEKSGCIAIAYETVTDNEGRLPLLAPMSEVAGRMATMVGCNVLMKPAGGRGVLLGGVPGVAPAKVTIIGGGVSGTHAMRMAIGLGAEVTVLDRNLNRLKEIDELFGNQVKTVYSTSEAVEQHCVEADLVIGTVLIPGASAPKLVTREILKKMRPGSVIVDVAIDQGGCCETSRPTTHEDPTFVEEEVVHYCVANMPGGVPHSSTHALNNATLPFVLQIADKGVWKALEDNPHLLNGLTVAKGKQTYEAVAEALDRPYTPAFEFINQIAA
ncbi:MAG: alanine dehydrogenase [Alphaproteobacteria bacterium]